LIDLLGPDEYYDTQGQGSSRNQLHRIGQFFRAPSLYLLDNNRRQAAKSNYSETSGEQFRLEPVDLRTEFDEPGDISHPLGIRTDERALVIRAKRRPVIIISQATVGWSDSGRQQDDSYLVAPVYSFGGDETKLSYRQTFIDRVKAYMYWQLFYLPPDGRRRIREGFVRLDRIQSVHRELLDHMPIRLSDDVIELLRDWIRVYLGEDLREVNGFLLEYRQEAVRQMSQGR
jgi:hypothetical protein